MELEMEAEDEKTETASFPEATAKRIATPSPSQIYGLQEKLSITQAAERQITPSAPTPSPTMLTPFAQTPSPSPLPSYEQSIWLTCEQLSNYVKTSAPHTSLERWGIPPAVSDAIALTAKIKSLYDWQAECLSKEEVLAGGNLMFCAPTSGGKSLVAETLMIRNILFYKQHAMREKISDSATLSPLASLRELMVSRDLSLPFTCLHTYFYLLQPKSNFGASTKAMYVLPYVSIVAEKVH